MKAPHGYEEICAFYGDPTKFIREDGTVSPVWESQMTAVPMPGPLPLGWNLALVARSVRVHKAIAEVMMLTFEELAATCWTKFRTYDGGFTWRLQRGPKVKLSMHAFGAALDFNAKTNRQGKPGDISPLIVAAFKKHGWTWGGDWKGTRVDPMHFQFGSGF